MSKFPDALKGQLNVAYLPLSKITAASRNARTHSPSQVQQIARSIAEFGWTNPILVDEKSVIIAGHGRLEAAKGLGLAEVPTIALAGLTTAQKRALAIADNKLALNAGWDDDTLRLELDDLKLDGFDLSLVGFNDVAVKRWQAFTGKTATLEHGGTFDETAASRGVTIDGA